MFNAIINGTGSTPTNPQVVNIDFDERDIVGYINYAPILGTFLVDDIITADNGATAIVTVVRGNLLTIDNIDETGGLWMDAVTFTGTGGATGTANYYGKVLDLTSYTSQCVLVKVISDTIAQSIFKIDFGDNVKYVRVIAKNDTQIAYITEQYGLGTGNIYVDSSPFIIQSNQNAQDYADFINVDGQALLYTYHNYFLD